jgi:hypothetical protein
MERADVVRPFFHQYQLSYIIMKIIFSYLTILLHFLIISSSVNFVFSGIYLKNERLI